MGYIWKVTPEAEPLWLYKNPARDWSTFAFLKRSSLVYSGLLPSPELAVFRTFVATQFLNQVVALTSRICMKWNVG